MTTVGYIVFGLGALCIVALVFRFLRGVYEIKDLGVGLVGSVLVGMLIFNKVGVKVGPDGTVQTDWEGSIFAADAKSNARVQQQIEDLDKRLKILTDFNPAARNQIAEVEKNTQPSPEQAQNSAFTILIFYRDSQQKKADKLLDELLRKGFKATSVATDLTEAVQQYDPGTSWIVWADGAKSITTRLSDIVSTVAPGTPIKVREAAYDLKRGDVQILLF